MSRAQPSSKSPATESLPRAPALTDGGAWQPADGVMFSILSSLVLWSIIVTSVYRALN
jgi:hypothetical protein